MTVFQRLVHYALQFKGPLLLGMIFLLITVGADILGPFVAKAMIDNHVQANVPIDLQPFLQLIALFFGLAIVSAVFRYFQYLLFQHASNRIVQTMRNDVFSHIQTLPIQYFDHLPAGKVVSRITNDTEAIRVLFVTVLSQFFTSIVTIIGIYIALFILDWKMAMIALILVPIVIIWMIVYRKFASRYNTIIRSKLSELNAKINESILGMPVIHAFGQEKNIQKDFDEANDEYYNNQNKLLVLDSLMSFNLVDALRSIIFIAFIAYFSTEAIGGNLAISAGLLYAFVDFITRLINPIMNLVSQLSHLERAKVASKRVFELLDQVGEAVSDEEVERFKGDVAFKDVSFSYQNDEYVLHDLNFAIPSGETAALVGHTGSGKSSIINLLFRFYDPQKGTITIDGKNIQHISKQAMRRHMGIVLQDPYLFTGTIASNIRLNEPTISDQQVEEALIAVGGQHLLDKFEKGIHEPVIEKGSTLSAGERQLISFARAFVFNPALLILDEATSNIDTETETIIQHAMSVLKQGRTTIIIAHRLSTIRDAEQIFVLDRGVIQERGNHEELMQQQGTYAQMVQLQLKE